MKQRNFWSIVEFMVFYMRSFSHKVIPENMTSYDFKSIGRYMVVWSTYVPTFLFYWYKFLDKALVGTTKTLIFSKMTLDQVLITPIFIAFFFITMNLMEGMRVMYTAVCSFLWTNIICIIKQKSIILWCDKDSIWFSKKGWPRYWNGDWIWNECLSIWFGKTKDENVLKTGQRRTSFCTKISSIDV